MINARTTFAALAFAALPVLGALGAAASANAQPVDPNNGPGKGCPIVQDDANGNTTVVGYANPGDRNGVLVCGNDGEWHFGKVAGQQSGPARIGTSPGKAL